MARKYEGGIKKTDSEIGVSPEGIKVEILRNPNRPMNTQMPDLYEAVQDQISADTEAIRKMFKPTKV